ncbi:MAG: HAD family phosphatase [Candidatus Micrarchaeaceae archaeon]
MLKNIIFDVGGVIINYNNNSYYYSPYLTKETGLSKEEIRKRIETRLLQLFEEARISKAEFCRSLAKSLGISQSRVRWAETFEEQARINMQTIETIRMLKRRYVIAYFSNVDYSRYAHARKMLKPYASLFDFKFASCVLRVAKPKARAFRIVLKRMGAKAEETLFIDDSAKNVLGASTAGLKSVLFKDNKQLRKDLHRLGVI